MNDPKVSIAITAGGPFIEDAVASVLKQDYLDIEILVVVDDRCDADTLALADRLARQDRRVIVELVGRSGPAVAVNRALEVAQGEWLAMMDGDDLIHPSRVTRLISVARRHGADIVADNALVFSDAGSFETLLGRSQAGAWLSAEDLRADTCSGGGRLGRLRPMVRVSAWRASGLRLDETAADQNFLTGLLRAGLRCRIEPFLGYFQRTRSSPVAAAQERRPKAMATRKVCFISRQRLLGRTNGSSAYLLDLAQAVRSAGMEPHLVQPSPKFLGRWPILRLKPEMAVFETIAMRGVIRLGPIVLARDASTWLGAAQAVAARTARRLGLAAGWLKEGPAHYAIAGPWTVEDQLFVARFARRSGDVLIADYAWQSEAFPYALRPRAPTAVVTHDLLHSQDPRTRATCETLGRDQEIGLLRQADAIIAIQAAEAREMEQMLPGRRIVLAPMTARAAASPQAGDPNVVLFVGSNTGPNVAGLRWMIDAVWPAVLRASPDARLLVAGNVRRAFDQAARGVRFLGAVDRLDGLYQRAGVVVSPLTTGSGLKIKLVEALALGKACVVTSVTLQGVEQEVGGAVALADEPDAFARGVVRLLADESARIELGVRALAAVRACFSPEQGHAAFIGWLKSERPEPARTSQRRPTLRGSVDIGLGQEIAAQVSLP